MADTDVLRIPVDTTQVDQATRALMRFERAGGRISGTSGHLERDIGRISGTFGSFDRTLGRLDATLGRLDATLGRLDATGGSVEGTFGRLTKIFGGLAVTGLAISAVTKSITAFREFEKSLVGVGKTADLTGKALQDLGDDITAISLSIPVTTKELLTIAQSAGQLGIKGSRNIREFTTVIAKLGRSSNLAGDEASTALARLLTVTGENIDQAGRLASQIVALGNNFATTEAEIARTAGEIGRATSIFKIGSGASVALAATMSQIGVSAELAGSSVGRTFRTIDKTIREGGVNLERLSKLTGQTGEQLKETFGRSKITVFQQFLQGLKRVAASGGDTTAVLASFKLKGEEILKTIPSLALASDELTKSFRFTGKEAQNATALNNEFARSLETLDSKLIILDNTFSAVSVKIGEFIVETHGLKAASEDLSLALVDVFNLPASEGNLVIRLRKAREEYEALQIAALTGGRLGILGLGRATDKRLQAAIEKVGEAEKALRAFRAEANAVSAATKEREALLLDTKAISEALAIQDKLTKAQDKANESLERQIQEIGLTSAEIRKLNITRAKGAVADAKATSASDGYTSSLEKHVALLRKHDIASTAVEFAEAQDKLAESQNKLTKAQDKANESLERQIQEIGLTKEELQDLTIARAQETLELARTNGASKAYLDSLDRQVDLLKERKTASGAFEAEKKAIKENEKLLKSLESSGRQVFDSIFDKGKSTFETLTGILKDTLLDLLFQMTVKKWIINITASVQKGGGLGSIVQGFQSGGVSGGIGAIGSAGVDIFDALSKEGGPASGLIKSKLGASLGLSTATAGLTSLGGGTSQLAVAGLAPTSGAALTFGTTGGLTSATAVGGGGVVSGATTTGATSAGFTATAAGSAFGAAAVGAMVGGITSSITGGNTTGSTVGGAVGGAIGSIWGPIGTAIGSVLGSLVGGLFGGSGEPLGPELSGRIIRDAEGELAVIMHANRVSAEQIASSRQVLEAQITTFENILDRTGLKFGRLTSQIDLFSANFVGADAKSLTENFFKQLGEQIKKGTFVGAAPALQRGVEEATTGSEVQQVIEEFITARDTIEQTLQGILDFEEELTPVEKAISDLNNQFLQLGLQAQDLGVELEKVDRAYDKAIDIMRDNFVEGMEEEILKLSDPGGVSFRALEEWREKAIREATALGVGMLQVQELFHLKQLQLEEKFHEDRIRVAKTLTSEALSELSRAIDKEKFLISQAVGNIESSISELSRAIAKEKSLISLSANDIQKSIRGLSNTLGVLQQALQTVQSMRITPSLEGLSSAAAVLEEALEFSRTGGKLAEFDGFFTALESAVDVDEKLFRTEVDFQRALGRSEALISSLIDETEATLSIEELSLQGIENTVNRLDQILIDSEREFNALRGIDDSVQSVESATSKFKESMRELSLLGIANVAQSVNRLDQILIDSQREFNALLGIDDSVQSVESALWKFNTSLQGLGESISGQNSAALSRSQNEVADLTKAYKTDITAANERADSALSAARTAEATARELTGLLSAASKAVDQLHGILKKVASSQGLSEFTNLNIDVIKGSFARSASTPTATRAVTPTATRAVTPTATRAVTPTATPVIGPPVALAISLTYDEFFTKKYGVSRSQYRALSASARSEAFKRGQATVAPTDWFRRYGLSTSEFYSLPLSERRAITNRGVVSVYTPITSFDVGTNVVPFDMIANVHKGERIIPAADNRKIISSMQEGGDSAKEIRDLTNIIISMAVDLKIVTRIQDRQDAEGIPAERIPA